MQSLLNFLSVFFIYLFFMYKNTQNNIPQVITTNTMLHQRHLPVTILILMTVCCPISHASYLRFLLRGDTDTTMTTYKPLVPEGVIMPLQTEIDALSNIEVQEDGRVVMPALGKSYLRSLFHLNNNRQSKLD